MLTLLWVKAGIECDGCGRPFSVFLDPGELVTGMDLHDLAASAVLAGNRSADNNAGLTAVVAGMHLCKRCQMIADDIDTPEDRDPTRDELDSALRDAATDAHRAKQTTR